MPKTKPPLLQVLFEPFPDHEDYTWNRDGGEVFAGSYWLDALEPDGAFRVRGYRAQIEGCSGCRRADDNPRAHWDMRNDSPGSFAPKQPRKCGKWQMVESIVKAFGGWKRVHYVELAAYERLTYQHIPRRKYLLIDCQLCADALTDPASCTDVRCGTRFPGKIMSVDHGPVLPDRFALRPTQRRMRSS